MKKFAAIVTLALGCVPVLAQQGKWLDTTKDTTATKYLYIEGNGTLLLTEDYEVLKTHEVCASLTGFFLKESQLGRYQVQFKGMRTSAEFVFTTQYDAEKWVEKFCTPESLLSIKSGNGTATMKRNY